MIKRLLTIGFVCLAAIGLMGQAQVNVYNQAGYPPGTTPKTASATGTTGALTATLTSAANRTVFICGFVITSGGTSAAIVTDTTVDGTIGGSLHFAYVDVSSGQGLLGVAFPQCIPASAQNTNIVVNVPAGSTGTVASVSAWGYIR